ncbi:MAG: hypothetical protein ACK5XZ_10900 [Hyphomonadaceae bacterium]|jgi:4-amino-4-deoxy-L-arabinose transferase-like glycosyltransferase|uniref:hypothetical protein n=1 Tax=Aquidulcibacter sp. TaxID=2052990 RepID=UPI0022C166BC|nr:hypothetical protein [Aquidulcibacter sp.]MCE2890796.1 hypothetical protein [Hyphomonadaceae bacterium]MCZ8207225.1 hypothetical protein [Aquidulcibacter sp.]
MTDARGTTLRYTLISLAIMALGICCTIFIPAGQDILWRLHIAEGILDGKILYRDLIEVNPPLWFWTALPTVWLSNLTGMSEHNILIGFSFAVILLTSALFLSLAKKTLEQPAALWLGVSFLAALCLSSIGDLGQREQSLLMASGLWLILLVVRMEGRQVPIWTAILVGLLAAYGFALKHYFVLIPLVLEGWLLWRQKRAWRPFRPETLVLGLCALAYAVAVWLYSPDFLNRILNLVQTAYFGFGPWNGLSPVERQLRLLTQCLFVAVPLAAMILTKERRPMAVGLMITILVATFIVLLQQKGWRYHFIAVYGLSTMLVLMILQRVRAERLQGFAATFALLAVPTLVWTAIVQPALVKIKAADGMVEPKLERLIAQEPLKSRIVILSTAPDNAFYPLAHMGRSYWSRHYSMWMMPGLLTPTADQKREAIRKTELARIRAEFVTDIQCAQPNLIVGEVGYFRNPEPKLFDAMAYLSEDGEFKAWLATHYEAQKSVGPYPIWRWKGPTVAAKACR